MHHFFLISLLLTPTTTPLPLLLPLHFSMGRNNDIAPSCIVQGGSGDAAGVFRMVQKGLKMVQGRFGHCSEGFRDGLGWFRAVWGAQRGFFVENEHRASTRASL